jgi:hypothetical protein
MKRYGDDAMLKAVERDEDDIVGAGHVASSSSWSVRSAASKHGPFFLCLILYSLCTILYIPGTLGQGR